MKLGTLLQERVITVDDFADDKMTGAPFHRLEDVLQGIGLGATGKYDLQNRTQINPCKNLFVSSPIFKAEASFMKEEPSLITTGEIRQKPLPSVLSILLGDLNIDSSGERHLLGNEETVFCSFRINRFATAQEIARDVFSSLELLLQSGKTHKREVYAALSDLLSNSLDTVQNAELLERHESPAITNSFLDSFKKTALPIQQENVYTDDELNWLD